MNERNIELEKKIKFLVVALSISAAFNVALLVNFSFIALKQEDISHDKAYFQEPKLEIPALASTLNDMLEKNMQQLTPILNDQTTLEEGYKSRDLALAVLSGFHYLNLEKALSGAMIQKRVARFEKRDSGEQFELTLYPGLSDEHFKAVNAFIKSEKWPITPEGIFFELKKQHSNFDASLKEAFFKTQHFEMIDLLFKRNYLSPSKETILKILLVSEFLQLDQLVQLLIRSGSFPKELLQDYLKQAIEQGSSYAATLFVDLDPNYVLKNLEDADLKKILKNLKVKTDKTLYFLKELIGSIRADAIRKEAALKLYVLYKDTMEPDASQGDVIKKMTVRDSPTPIEKKENPKLHTVKAGETLWQIARQHKTSVKEITDKNGLDRNKPLQIGKVLNIP